jgi:hypothetical protein
MRGDRKGGARRFAEKLRTVCGAAGESGQAEAGWVGPGQAEAEVTDALAELLAAASAPARRHELTGYESARQAFEAAAAEARSPKGRHSSLVPLTRAAAVKITIVAAVLSLAGVSVAAATGTLPSPIQRVAHDVFGVPAPDPVTSQVHPSGSGVKPAMTPQGAKPSRQVGDGTPVPSDSPSGALAKERPANPEIVRLCQLLVRNGGKGLNAAQRRKLVLQADGEQNVAAYCAQVLSRARPVSGPTTSTASDPAAPHPGRTSGDPGPKNRNHGGPKSTRRIQGV